MLDTEESQINSKKVHDRNTGRTLTWVDSKSKDWTFYPKYHGCNVRTIPRLNSESATILRLCTDIGLSVVDLSIQIDNTSELSRDHL